VRTKVSSLRRLYLILGITSAATILVGACGPVPNRTAASPTVPVVAPATVEPVRPATITRIPVQWTPPSQSGEPTTSSQPNASAPNSVALTSLQNRSSEYEEAVRSIGGVEQKLAQVRKDPSLLNDKDWQTGITHDTTVMKSIGEQFVQKRSEPAEYAEMDGWFVLSGQEMVGAADTVAGALSAKNVQSLEQASDQLSKSDVYLMHVNQLLNESKKNDVIAR